MGKPEEQLAKGLARLREGKKVATWVAREALGVPSGNSPPHEVIDQVMASLHNCLHSLKGKAHSLERLDELRTAVNAARIILNVMPL